MKERDALEDSYNRYIENCRHKTAWKNEYTTVLAQPEPQPQSHINHEQ